VDLGDHLQAIWRRRWVILVVCVLATAGVVGVRMQAEEVYRATARLILSGPTSAAGTRGQDLVFAASTFVARAESPDVLSDAVDRADLSLPVATVDDRTSVSLSSSDATAAVEATGPTPAQAAALANGLADALVERVAEVQAESRETLVNPIERDIAAVRRTLARTQPGDPEFAVATQEYAALRNARRQADLAPQLRLEVLRPATEPGSAESPQLLREGALAFLVTLAVAAEGAALWEWRKRSRRVGGTHEP